VSDLISQTARLVPYGKRPRHVPSFVTAYAYEPLAGDPGAELGNLYVVIEALVSGRASEEVADLIIETVGDHYYNQDQDGSEALERFEHAVKGTNAELGEHVSRGNAAWIGKLSAVIAVQAGSELHVAQTGSAEALLYRGKSSTRIATDSSARPVQPTKTFGSIASGQLDAGDRLLLATPALIHQVPLTRLQSIITQNGPNASIAEITDLLKGASVDRIAALIIEITTPELAALQVRSEQPSEIHLGSPETALEAVKLVTEPLAQNTVASSKKVASVARAGWHHAKPRARNVGLTAADMLRRLLSSKGRRRQAVAAVGILVAVLVIFTIIQAGHATSTATFKQYQAAYNQYLQAGRLADTGDKPGARGLYNSVQHQLASLKPKQGQIDSHLQHSALPKGEPKSYSALISLISSNLDQLDGLMRVTPVTIANLSQNAKPEHFEIASGKAYVIDSSNHNQLTIVNLANGATHLSSADLSSAGDVISTTISSGNDGIYILTSTPSVWFYRFATDSVSPQKISYGAWQKSVAISSYASNIYLLSADGTINKYTHNAAGFSPKIVYFSTTNSNSSTTSLAVDGSVYSVSADGLHLYAAGSLKQTSPVPGQLGAITNLRTTAKDDFLVGTSNTSHRVAVWSISGASPAFSHQLELQNASQLYDAAYDSAAKTFYALVDNRLVRFASPF
jgi:hypothetical protein